MFDKSYVFKLHKGHSQRLTQKNITEVLKYIHQKGFTNFYISVEDGNLCIKDLYCVIKLNDVIVLDGAEETGDSSLRALSANDFIISEVN